MDKLSELLKDFYKHFAGLGIYIIPGVVILETVFNSGFFGEEISNIYDFVLFVFWALVLGIPFHFSQPEQLNAIIQKFKKDNNEFFWDGLSDELELGFIIVKTLTFYLTYKFIIWQDCLRFKTWFNINENVANYLIATIITVGLGLILIFPYKWYLEKRYLNK